MTPFPLLPPERSATNAVRSPGTEVVLFESETTTESGTQMVVIVGIGLYACVAAALVRVFQSIHKRDDEIRTMTTEWIDEISGVPLNHHP